MKRLTQLLTVLMIASAPAAFAATSDSAGSQSHPEAQPGAPGGGSFDEGDGAWSGGGRGEPQTLAAGSDREERGRAEQQARDEAAIKDYAQQVFLNDTWTKP
jgi:hypothetical protein